MARPKKFKEDVKMYNIALPIKTFEKLSKISLHETQNSLEHISIADIIRDSIDIYVGAYEQNFDEKGNIRGKS
tara:strand:+ start:215 stop:433 length:219 start_codon:yes stop_codon:yes gene_type:complete